MDSGNLSGHLLTLRPGLLALPDHKILGARCFDGLSDTLGVLMDAEGGAAPARFASLQEDLASASDSMTLTEARRCLERLAATAAEVAGSLDANPESEASWWAHAFAQQCQGVLDDLTFLAPWTSLPASQDRPGGFRGIDEIPTLRELASLEAELLPAIKARPGMDAYPGDNDSPGELRRLITEASHRAKGRIAAIERLALQAGELARVEYDFLFDKARHLLAIGYNVDERRLDSSYYDLLASEARLCSFVAIAQGKLPQESWFALGRLLTTTGGEPVLLSWSGSMFEYLMPLLVMPTYEDTLLDRTYQAAVQGQIEYGRGRGLPWGMSESGYNTIDVQHNYQYRAFGVPGLGLKRGLADDLGHCALCLGACPDGDTRGGVPESAATRH